MFGDTKREVLDRIAEVDVRISQHNGEIMKLREERLMLDRALIPFLPKPEVLWQLSEFDLHCHNCGEITRMKYRGAALCADSKCIGRVEKKPVVRSSKAMTPDVMDLVKQMLSGNFPKPPMAEPNDDDEPDDTEYIKVRP
jgi:hypothetical protein